MQSVPNPRKKCFWTDALDLQLRRLYETAKTRSELCDGITVFMKRTGFGRGVVRSRAQRLGFVFCKMRRWTDDELQQLRDRAGSQSVYLIARHLKRSYESVQRQMWRMNLSTEVLDGYTQAQLAELLGVATKSTRRWIRLGYIKMRDGRFSDQAVIKFLKAHPEEYTFKRVDESWLKGMLFPEARCFNSLYGVLKPTEVAAPDFDEEIA